MRSEHQEFISAAFRQRGNAFGGRSDFVNERCLEALCAEELSYGPQDCLDIVVVVASNDIETFERGSTMRQRGDAVDHGVVMPRAEPFVMRGDVPEHSSRIGTSVDC